MPGRGQYWKKGGLIDETVKEEDLSQALQTKVNSGGGSGVFELIKTITVGSNVDTAQITLDTPINFADYAEIELVVTGKLVTALGRVEVTLNSDNANSEYAWMGSVVGGGVSAFVENGSNPFWEMDNANLLLNSMFYIKIVLAGGTNLEPNFRRGTGVQTWRKDTGALISSVGGLRVNTISVATQLASFEVSIGGVGEIGTGSILSVFGKKIV